MIQCADLCSGGPHMLSPNFRLPLSDVIFSEPVLYECEQCVRRPALWQLSSGHTMGQVGLQGPGG